MKKLALSFVAFTMLTMFTTTGCGNIKTEPAGADSDTIVEDTVMAIDSTVYGVCGEGSAMHSLELITDEGDTLLYTTNIEEEEAAGVVGGMMAGDRIAVVGHLENGELLIDKAVNLTTLLGKWTSLDKNFEILEGGSVSSHVTAEANPWTTWKICNGMLLLNTDTFSVVELGADSLYLESSKGIFTYKRQQ